MTDTHARAVQFDQYGGLDVLYLADIPMPEPGAGEVVVAVRVAGINPVDGLIRAGYMHDLFPTTFPSRQGSDYCRSGHLPRSERH